MSDIVYINSISKIHELLGYPKPKHPLITLIDFTNISLPNNMDKLKFVTGFYTIVLKFQAQCNFKYGRENYDFEEGSMLFMAPEQTIFFEGKNDDINSNGWGLFFHPDLIRNSFLIDKMKDYTFFSYNSNEALHLSESERNTITNVVESIEREYSRNIDIYSRDVIISNIELLLSHSKRFYGRQFITRNTQNLNVIGKFEEVLNNYYINNIQLESGLPTVQYFADNLNLSSPYLTDLLKQETGKNTQELIHSFVVEKAKTKLLNSNISISELAFDLGFEYPQYFSRMFKKKTGMTPIEFRDVG